MQEMQTDEAKVVLENSKLFVNLPLTKPTGKIRVKERSLFSEYGQPIATRNAQISQKCYVEWQIGYDLLANEENASKTSLNDLRFVNYKGDSKFAYELSEVVSISAKRGLITLDDIKTCLDAIKAVNPSVTFEETASVSRTHPKEKVINGLPFYEMMVSYPLFVHRFGRYDILAEVMIREKQRAVGTQAMLYVCLPITSLKFKHEAIGRSLNAKECAEWVIGSDEAKLALELFRVFGMLSPKHRHDVMAILEMLFPSLAKDSTRG